jgi:2-polyprenyl-6-methoxyphenol hydroxylase-like FAD-dependent oxidoreductase
MDHDLIIVGGGLAGSTLGKNMAESGRSVLLIERETKFKDRIRGEAMHPWGVIEAQRLGIFDALHETCGHVCDHWKTYFQGKLITDRYLPATNPHGVGELHFYHPRMQETLIALAAEAGVQVRRGARLSRLNVKRREVEWRENGSEHGASARLIVGADGSRSMIRNRAGFEVNQDDDWLQLAGVMMENTRIPEDSVHVFQGEEAVVLFFPQGSGLTRSYISFTYETQDEHFIGDSHKGNYLSLCRRLGVPEEWIKDAELTGPLAEFQGADRWAQQPAMPGVVLIGDAAAKPDPNWGTGLSLTLRDVRTLRDELLKDDDWDAACTRYAEAHNRYYGNLRKVESWFGHLLWDRGEAADARRLEVLPHLEKAGAPDIVGLGPESPTQLRIS